MGVEAAHQPTWTDSGRRVDAKRKLRGLLTEEWRLNIGQVKIMDICFSPR